MQPKVSIITPFLNSEAYFQEAIESVLAQQETSWELLLVDDGSSDGSSEMAIDYATRYPEQIRYFDHPDHRNLGKSTSRNLGIQHARGDYLVFFDADDVLLPDKLARQVALLDAHPQLGLLYGRTLYWYSWTGKAEDSKRDLISRLGIAPGSVIAPPDLLTLYLRDDGLVPCLCAILARRSLVEAIGGYDEAIQHLYEDQIFIAKLCLASSVLIEDGCGEKYRQHAQSSSHLAIQSGEYHPIFPSKSQQLYLQRLLEYLNEKEIQDAELRRLVEYKLWLYRNPLLLYPWSVARYLWLYGKGFVNARLQHGSNV